MTKAKKLLKLEDAERQHRLAERVSRHYRGGDPNRAARNKYIDLRREFIKQYGADALPEHMRP